jgi:DNA polymerase-3 subunit epsilon
MPINFDLLNQAKDHAQQKAAEYEANVEREKQEREAHALNWLVDFFAQLGIQSELRGHDAYPYIHADSFAFALREQTNDAMRDRYFLITHKQTGDSDTLLMPFYSLPDTWHIDHKRSFQARLHDILTRLNRHNEVHTPAAQTDDEQPLDLMPTTMIQDDCEAAYDLLKQFISLVGEALDYAKLSSHEDVKTTLYIMSAKLADFLASDDDEPEPDETEFADPGYIGDGFTNEYDYDHPVHGNAADEPAADDEPAPVDPFIALIRSGDFVILDTETTGLGSDAEICQIAIIDSSGNVLLDQLVKPQKPIPASATAIHHISNEMVKDAPSWLNVNEKVWQLLHGKQVIVYNAEYDFRLIAQSEKACEPLALSDWHTIQRHCAMLHFSEVYGEWNSYHGNYKWQKLETAARYYEQPVNAAHNALGDCLMTLAVCKAMAAE